MALMDVPRPVVMAAKVSQFRGQAGASSATMMGSGSMMGGGSMMGAGSGMMGGTMMQAAMSAEDIAAMPVDGAFEMVSQVCSACHTKFRAESK